MKELSRAMVIALGAAPARRGPRAVAAAAPADILRNSRRVLMRSSGARKMCGDPWFRDHRRAGRGLSRPAGLDTHGAPAYHTRRTGRRSGPESALTRRT